MIDRHAAELSALRRAVLETPAATERALREAVFNGDQLAEPVASYVATIQGESHRVRDSDVAGLLAAGYSEDAVFELTLAAAIGAAVQRLEAGLRALREPS